MLFTSYVFWIFFAFVWLVYANLKHKAQNWWLLAASYVFYGCWNWRFVVLLVAATLVTYYCAQRIGRAADQPKQRRWWLGLGLAWNVGGLFYFKYVGWLLNETRALLTTLGMSDPGWVLSIALPVGISFFTFQLLSYLLDVYREKSEPTQNLLEFANFVAFFPHIAAGPIARQDRLQPQFETPRERMSEDTFREGLYHIMIGLFRKVVVADNMAVIVNHVYDRPASEITFPEFLLGTYAFAFQVYGDFAGYSSMAQGIAKWLGIDLAANFRNPYFAENPSDFWKRWHISLSSLLRDYVFIPLSMSNPSLIATCRNLFLTMVVAGLWHGANWTFAAWGAFHGLWLCVEAINRKRAGNKAPVAGGWRKTMRILVCFHLVCISYVFFRADSLAQVWTLVSSVVHSWQWTSFCSFGYGYLLFFALPLVAYEWWTERERDILVLTSKPWAYRAVAYALIVIMMLFFAPPSANEFVYFRF